MIEVNTIRTLTQKIEQKLIAIRRHLHQFPELSFEEHNTSQYIKRILQEHNIPFTEGWVDTGIVAYLGKKESKNIVALRGDMDALPIHEKNNCEYTSQNKGIMHACGHDVHTTCALGAAIVLKEIEASLDGQILIVFQPGEEKLPGGASLMLKEGALGNPLPKAILGLHVFPEMEVGNLGFKTGEYMASTDEIYITVKGKGGHAAMKNQYNNPLLIASKLLLALNTAFDEQTVKQYTQQPTVLAFGKIEGLGATNVIPDIVSLQGTFRAMDETWREKAHEIIQTISNTICVENAGQAEVTIAKGYPVLVNHETITERCINLAKDLLGEQHVHPLQKRMTAEDFAYYSQVMPACFFRLGTANAAKGIISPVHTATFDIDEKALTVGSSSLAWMALNVLNA